MRIEKKRRNATTTGMLLKTEIDSTRPRRKTTKAPARSHHRRLASQSTPDSLMDRCRPRIVAGGGQTSLDTRLGPDPQNY
jgi:hypothetical protein